MLCNIIVVVLLLLSYLATYSVIHEILRKHSIYSSSISFCCEVMYYIYRVVLAVHLTPEYILAHHGKYWYKTRR